MTNDLEPTPAEQKLIDAAKVGGLADLTSTDETANDPANGADWARDRTIRASVIYALAVGSNANWPVHARGVRLQGARIVGELDFAAAELSRPLALLRCYVEQPINLEGASVHSVSLNGSRIDRLKADGLQTRYDLCLNGGFTADGGASLRGAHIQGLLDCREATFENQNGHALDADRINVDGDAFLSDGFTANGYVGLKGAKIGGNLECERANFCNPKDDALDAKRLTVGGSFLGKGVKVKGVLRLTNSRITGNVELIEGTFENTGETALNLAVSAVGGDVAMRRGFKARGEVRLQGSEINGNLECEGGLFENENGFAISADRLRIKGSVFLRDKFKAVGNVQFPRAEVGSNFECDGGSFQSPNGIALYGDGMSVNGNVVLSNRFEAKGEVRLRNAKIGRNFDCSRGAFRNGSRIALNASRLAVEGHALLRDGFNAAGEVRLVSAKIGGNLDCNRATFENDASSLLDQGGAKALDATRISVEGTVSFSGGFKAKGKVRFLEASVGGNLDCEGATFENRGATSLNLAGATIQRSLFLQSLKVAPIGIVDLSFAHTAELADDISGWPEAGLLMLRGLTYDILAGPTDARRRCDWLNRQPSGQFSPQPYEQLSRVLRGMGHDRDAQKISIAKQQALRESGELGRLRWLWSWVLAITVRYGYHPSLILVWMIPLVLIGSAVLWYADHKSWMAPTKESIYLNPRFVRSATGWELPPQYPKFQPIVYSLDVFFPVVDLQQKAYWQPTEWPFRTFYWLHTIAGWLFTALAVAGLTRLVKKD